MGGVFLKRRRRPEAEVVNDWSKDVATFYRVLQRHYAAFLDMLRFQITSRAEFERLVGVDPDRLTDMERAARFLYLQRTAFGGKVSSRHFGMSHHRSGRFDIGRLNVILEELHDRLGGVIIERLPWRDFLRRYDTPETLFYLDPPYWGSESDYGSELFGRAELEAMPDVLAGLSGRWLLSINDVPATRALFGESEVLEVETTYALPGGHGQRARELIVRKP